MRIQQQGHGDAAGGADELTGDVDQQRAGGDAGETVGEGARDRDRRGRSLPVWKGCRTLRAGEVFLLNANVPDSFDGRYFGPVSATAITGRAEPLWTIGKD